jgi:hypothetical protein
MSGFDEGPRWPERDLPREPDREPPAEPPTEPWRPRWQPPPADESPFQDQPAEPAPPEPEPEPYREPEPPEPEPPPEPAPQPEPEDTLPAPETEAAAATTSLGGGGSSDDWDPRRDGDRRRPTTAEQAVPWLIGLLLALTGIVVVLLALIFIGPSGVAGIATPSPSVSVAPSLSVAPALSTRPITTESPSATAAPTFGALEMTYLGRATAASPIRLSRRDFSTKGDPVVLAQDPKGVGKYAWAPDGRVGVAILSGRAVAVVPGQALRTLTDPVDAVVFGDDSTTLYGLRISKDGANDRAEVLKIDFDTGATVVMTTITYPHPEIIADPALKEAQFADNGGLVRLWATTDGYLVAWILGAPSTYRIDPADGTFSAAAAQPVLWSTDQRTRVNVTEKSGITTLTLIDRDELAKATVKITGLVSHVRWAASNNEIVFTLGRLVGGGVRQDLYVWDLVNGKAPSPLTSNGASFGAEWLGVLQSWVP